MLDFQNSIDPGQWHETVLVTAGSGTATADAQLSGALSGSGGLSIKGDGTLILSGADNTYSGGTEVDSATLVLTAGGALPGKSNLILDAGTLIFDPSRLSGSPASLDAAQGAAAVPEPAAPTLLAGASGLLLMYRRLRRAGEGICSSRKNFPLGGG